MKVKTIKTVIQKKLDEWLSSIDDKQLRNDVRNNLVLSGGSITSMLLKEPVNDYDIYIVDPLVCSLLAEYYIKLANKNIDVLNGNMKESYLENENIEDWDLSESAIMYKTLHAGQIKLNVSGAGLPIFYEKERETELKEKGYYPVFFSQNAISLSDQIQIVTRFTGTVKEIHKSYDFVHATNYFTFEKGLVLNKLALQCILTKELRYQGSLYPLTSVIRMKKFIARKWTMNAGEVLKMLWQCSELNLKDPLVLEEQLVGVDIAYFSRLVDMLSQVKTEDRNYSYLTELIDKIFNETDIDE